MEVKKRFTFHNRFDFELRDAKTDELKQQAYAENIILDALWTKLFSSTPNYFAYLHIGTGTGTLAASRTSLFTFLVAKAVGSATYTDDTVNGVVGARRSAQLLESENVGAVISEIGIASGSGSTTLMTHAMLKDMNGNTVTITKTNLDILTIYATVYIKYAVGGWDSGKVQILGDITNNDLIKWVAGEKNIALTNGKFNFNIGTGKDALNISRYAGYNYSNIDTTETIDAANKRITYYARLPAASGNVSGYGIASVRLSPFSNPVLIWDLRDSTAHTGNAIVGEQIGVGNGSTKDFAVKFPFIQSGAVVKRDGVVVSSGVTVDYNKPPNDICPYCNAISAPFYWCPGTAQYIDNYSHSIDGVFENPFYATYGIYSIHEFGSAGTWYSSDDATNWTTFTMTGSAPSVIPLAHRKKRYYRWVGTGGSTTILNRFISDDVATTSVHFETAPATGEVITLDYTTAVAAKDSTRVLDFTAVIQLGEYTP